MRVTFDDQVFLLQRHGGISRYFAELLRAFAAGSDVQARTPFRWVVNHQLHELAPRHFVPPRVPARAQRERVLHPVNALLSPRRPGRADVVHHTYYLPHRLPGPGREARICTVYDMIPEKLPELFPAGNPHRAKDAYVAACDAILCISQSTKDDVLRHYGPLDKPVVVTPLGVTDAFFAARADDAAEPYVLFVGQRSGYKNADVLLRALARLTFPVRLLCVGGPPFDAAELERIADLGLEKLVERREVADADLPGVYAAAACLVFPSRHEGFGLPIVEAFAAGCPVVLADMTCSREVGGDAAQFFDPDDADELAGLLDRLLGDGAERARWVARGRTRARDFTWRRTADLTAAVYRDVAHR